MVERGLMLQVHNYSEVSADHYEEPIRRVYSPIRFSLVHQSCVSAIGSLVLDLVFKQYIVPLALRIFGFFNLTRFPVNLSYGFLLGGSKLLIKLKSVRTSMCG